MMLVISRNGWKIDGRRRGCHNTESLDSASKWVAKKAPGGEEGATALGPSEALAPYSWRHTLLLPTIAPTEQTSVASC